MLRWCASPEDFVVDEIPLFSPSGDGAHTYLWVEKRLRTTEAVARDLARAAGVAPRDVGFAGRKDRNAVARQWFSVPGLDPQRARRLELAGVRVLEAVRHPHKLRTGQLRGNGFTLTLRGLPPALRARLPARLAELAVRGFPNRFGAQRFGRDGRNAERGRALLGGHGARADRRTARLWLSALQAAVFNDVLAARPLSPDRVEAGDVAVVHRSGGLFRVEDAAREQPRADAFEISPTGPIFGRRAPQPAGEVAERERRALLARGVPPGDELRAPPGLRLRGGRRALRARPEQPHAELRGDALQLRFELPAGSFATVLLEELLRGAGSPPDDTGAPRAVC